MFGELYLDISGDLGMSAELGLLGKLCMFEKSEDIGE